MEQRDQAKAPDGGGDVTVPGAALPEPPAPPAPPTPPAPPGPPALPESPAVTEPECDPEPEAATEPPADEALERSLPEGVRKRVVGIAADGLSGLTPAELPARLRPYVKFTREARVKRGATAIAAALETEPAFRSRIAERVRQGQPDLVAALEAGTVPAAADPQDVAAAAYLLRTTGWARIVGEVGEEVERAEHEGHAAESARLAEKLQSELAELRAVVRADAERAKAELEGAKKEGDSLRRQLRSLAADTKRAEAATRKATAELDALRASGATERGAQDSEVRRLKHRVSELEAALEASRRAAREGRSAEEIRLRLLLDTVVQGAQGLQRELGLAPLSGRPADSVEAVSPVAASPHDVARRAIEGDDPALLEQLLQLPQVHLLVDGYNVTKTGWPDMPLDRQRQQLLRGLGLVAAQTGAEVTCVFDGQDLDGPIPMAPPPRGVRVLFSRTGETADELIRRLVRAEPEGRPVVVVSTDREVADGVRKSGARPVPSTMLLRRLVRS